jgi:hypothetical protein
VVTRIMSFTGLDLGSCCLRAVLDSEAFCMTSFPDLEKALPSLQDQFAITVVHLTECRELRTIVQRGFEKRQEAAVVIPRCWTPVNATIN